jgi:hypothetical protein
MRWSTRLLNAAALLVAVAVGAHLLMAVQPAEHGAVGQPGAATALHAASPTSGAGIALPPRHAPAGFDTAVDDGRTDGGQGAHLMATLCFAVLAAGLLTALALTDRGLVRQLTAAVPLRTLATRPPVRPPRSHSRVDAGIVLLV